MVTGVERLNLASFLQTGLAKAGRKYKQVETENFALSLSKTPKESGLHDYEVTIATQPPVTVTLDSTTGDLVKGKIENKEINPEDFLEGVKVAIFKLVSFANMTINQHPKQSIQTLIGNEKVTINQYNVHDLYSSQSGETHQLVTHQALDTYQGPTLDNPVAGK